MLKVAVGHSNDPDSRSAIDDVIKQCQAVLAGATPNAGILYMAIDFDHAEILHQLDQVFPNLELIGCTTDGELSSALAFQQDSIVLTLFCSDEIEIRAGLGRNLAQDPVRAAKQAVEQADGNHSAQLCIALPESLTISAAATLNGLKAALGQTFPIFGGFAADQWQFKQTFQFYKTEVVSDALPILLFSGSSLKFSHGACTGFQPVSRLGRVTKADRNVVYEIDGKSALEFYGDYFGVLEPSPEHPFAVFDENDRFYLRGFSSFDRTMGSITAFADFSEGDSLKLATASREDIIAAAKQPILEALQAYPGIEPSVALFFPCGANRQLLGTRIEEEFQQMQASLGDQIPCCGFYTYGELASLDEQGETHLLQHTVVTLLLGIR